MNAITEALERLHNGEPAAAAEILPLVYDELRKLAAARLAREAPGQTLDATALVHEAYLRLVDRDPAKPWDGRRHFFAAAAEAMRRILVENARRKRTEKHGGGRRAGEALHDVEIVAPEPTDPIDLLDLDEALSRLEAEHPDHAELVRLRHFAGLSGEEAAEVLGISRATVERRWAFARAWLLDALGGPTG